MKSIPQGRYYQNKMNNHKFKILIFQITMNLLSSTKIYLSENKVKKIN